MDSHTVKRAFLKPQEACTMVSPGIPHLHPSSVRSSNACWPQPSTWSQMCMAGPLAGLVRRFAQQGEGTDSNKGEIH